MIRYGVGFTPEMQGMADCAVRAATEIRDAMPLLGAIDRSVDRLSAMSVAVRRIEGEADELLDRGLRVLFAGDSSPATSSPWRRSTTWSRPWSTAARTSST